MKKHTSLIVPIILILSSAAYAAGYLDRLRGIDQSVICVVLWFAPATAVVLFALGGFLYSTGNLTNRSLGKSYMLNSLAGMFLVVAFLGIAFALVPTLTVDKCLGTAPAEKKCADSGGQCGCQNGQVCESGSLVSDVTDCPATCCKKCVAPEKTCEENSGYKCGDCPTGQTCVESTAKCDSGQKCCQCVEEQTCEKLGLTCGCDTAAGELCQPGTEKENVGTCAKCCKCIKPCSSDTFGKKCCIGPSGLVIQCKEDECHNDPGCHYFWRPALSYETCHSCCSSDPVKTCDQYLSQASCEGNPCALSKGGWVPTDCTWTTCDLGSTSIPCCKPK